MSSDDLAAVFLRGVNIGGVTIKSAPLRACLESIDGVTAAKTVLASGNAVVRTSLTPPPLRASVEEALRAEFGYDAWVVALTVAEVADLADRCPYAMDDKSLHAYVTLASDPATLDLWERVAGDLNQEHTRLSPTAFAWTCPAGQSLKVPFAKAQTKQPLKEHAPSVTTRNGRTLLRVLAAAATI